MVTHLGLPVRGPCRRRALRNSKLSPGPWGPIPALPKTDLEGSRAPISDEIVLKPGDPSGLPPGGLGGGSRPGKKRGVWGAAAPNKGVWGAGPPQIEAGGLGPAAPQSPFKRPFYKRSLSNDKLATTR